MIKFNLGHLKSPTKIRLTIYKVKIKKLGSIFAADSNPKETKTCISIDEWIDVWGTIVGSAKRMDDFPMWLQYYPKVLFDIINRSGMFLKFIA